MSHLNKVWVIGDASVDLVPERTDSYLKCPGGASANVAVCVARLGGDCGFIGCLGEDDAGRFLRQTLAENGVGVGSLRLDPQQTSAVLIVNLTPEGERSFTYLVHPGADTFVSVQDLPAFSANEWFYFSSIGLTDSPAREACLEGARRMKAAGGHVMFDVNLRVSMWRDTHEIAPLLAQSIALASICKVSADELCWLGKVERWQDARYLMRELGCETTVISLGDEGAYLVTPEGECAFPTAKISVVDTTGAGDAFVGGLLYTLSQAANWDSRLLAQAIGTANACGAMVVTAKGAMTALPYPEQLAAFRASHPLEKSC
ncbi:aminoimidazole riboside kinase [Citrobacter farmeri]|uniref:Aminoimidazole riboside kinase n=1 Tax=Citrobacter amalonaticus Y19 TaxID=1261127 RepID=A0A0F6TYM0_CITAM|nr:aminoimidazole riboside kinase [Citrobacter amalonaticus]AKE60961.1 aminoimidazole riboside kinase [Citrobacter amalonaticus Y19]EKV5656996.1 aminoimidazole riboside kinase [Citrobacter farmeri]